MDIAVKAIIIKNGKILFQEQSVNDKKFYTLPGGRIKSNNFINELIREVKEETGLEIEVGKYIGEWSFVRESNGVNTMCKTYLCKIISGELNSLQKEENEKIVRYSWLDGAEFINGNYTDNISLISILKKYV